MSASAAGMMDDHVRRLAEDEQRVDRLLQLLATPTTGAHPSTSSLARPAPDSRVGQSPMHSSSLTMEIAADGRLARPSATIADLSLSASAAASREQLRANLPTELTYFMPPHNDGEARKRLVVEEAISGARGPSRTRTHDEARKRIVEEALSGARGVRLLRRSRAYVALRDQATRFRAGTSAGGARPPGPALAGGRAVSRGTLALSIAADQVAPCCDAAFPQRPASIFCLPGMQASANRALNAAKPSQARRRCRAVTHPHRGLVA